MRVTLLLAVVQAWAIVVIVALIAPHLLILLLALTVPYSIMMPFALRYIERDIKRRTVNSTNSMVRIARETGLTS